MKKIIHLSIITLGFLIILTGLDPSFISMAKTPSVTPTNLSVPKIDLNYFLQQRNYFLPLLERIKREEKSCRRQLRQIIKKKPAPLRHSNKHNYFYQNENEAIEKLEKLFEIRRPTETIDQYERFILEHGKRVANELWFKGKTDYLSFCGAMDRINFINQIFQDAHHENWSSQSFQKISSLTLEYLYREFQHYDHFLYTSIHLYHLKGLNDLKLLPSQFAKDIHLLLAVLDETATLTRQRLKEERLENFSEEEWEFLHELRTENEILRFQAKELIEKIRPLLSKFQ